MRLARVLVAGSPRHCLVDGDRLRVLAGGIDRIEPTGQTMPIDQAEFLSPVEPTKVLAVLGAFLFGRPRDVARETAPKFTSKLTTSLTGHRQPILKPFDTTSSLDGEAELAVAISRDVRRVSPEEARAAILGFTLANDVTLPGWGKQDGDFMRAKSADTFCALGPYLDTGISPDEVTRGLVIRGHVNGILTQQGNTSNYTWNVLETISWASQLFTLRRFDVIALGTPPPPSPMDVGDVMSVTVDGIGTLANEVAAEPRPPHYSPPPA